MSENNFESLGLTLLVDVQLPNLQSQDDLKELYLLAQSGEDVVYSVSCKRIILIQARL